MISNPLIRPLISTSLRLSTHLAFHPNHANSNLAFSPLSLHSLLGLLTAGSTGRTQLQLLSFLGAKNASELSALHSHVSSVVLADGPVLGGPTERLGVSLADGPVLGRPTVSHVSGCWANDGPVLGRPTVRQVSGGWANNGPVLGGPTVKYVSGVWADDGPFMTMKKSFREVAESVHKAETRPVPFRSAPEECRKEINKWAKQNTAGRIKDLLAPGLINIDTRLILCNAMYFRGAWSDPFEPRLTKKRTFHLIDGTKIETPFMSSSEKQYYISVYDEFKVLNMPYKHGGDRRQFSFSIFLPNASDGLLDLSTKLNSDPDFLNNHVPMEKVPVGDFGIPKFKITMEYKFSDILANLGLVLPFQQTGDFSAMVDSPEIKEFYVSEIVQKCFVGVNEKGTEAAAVSAGGMCSSCAPFRDERKPIDFVADRPFLFVIREDTTGVVLFVGRLLNPHM